eukprot:11802576-Prorocentrum_lima.AAC.1
MQAEFGGGGEASDANLSSLQVKAGHQEDHRRENLGDPGGTTKRDDLGDSYGTCLLYTSPSPRDSTSS